MMTAKITEKHLSRLACVYIRQSTPAQVRFNQESTERQYDLAGKAQTLGWRPEQIRILDRDLGQSGSRTTNRTDFKALVSDVAMGTVGAIFSLEASRLARSNQDWHRLLELCAITNTLVIDEDGCYDPTEFNDGLVLGMKGTFAQAELHIIRSRLHGGKLNKAKKGCLRFPLPVGYVWDGDKIVIDPDQEVQGAVRTVFELFEKEGTAYAVVQRFQAFGLRFPRRSYGGIWNGKLVWGRLTHSRVIGLLANPSYAGVYVFGRYQSRKQVAPSGEISTVSRPMPREEWRVTIPDHHPGYITWDRFLANRHRLESNKTNSELIAGPAREGLCLLQGMLVCGCCGRRLTVRYTGNGGLYPSYECNHARREGLMRQNCVTTRATPIDTAIGERLLAAVTSVTIELALKALTTLEERDQAIGAQWRRRIERARYEADLAERRYEAVDPANRLIAATLEQRWNDALQRVAEIEAELQNFERQTLRTITADQKQQILQLAGNFPKLWTAPTTTPRDRKRMLRVLIKDITISRGTERQLLLQIRWQGGATESIALRLPPKRPDAVRYPSEFVGRIRQLAEDYDDCEIAGRLDSEGLKSATGKRFTTAMISWVRFKYSIAGPARPAGALSVANIAQRYGINPSVVYYWIETGVIDAQRRRPGVPYAITITDEVDRDLRERITRSSRIRPLSQEPTARGAV
jgi:DNA invertase Pin-like site-specific DNA recombinase